MIRSVFALTVLMTIGAVVVSGYAVARPVLQKSTAETAAKRILVTEAKEQGVKVKTAEARATCSAATRPPNTFDCKLSEKQKRCKGKTQIYLQGGQGVTSARSTSVTCSRKKR